MLLRILIALPDAPARRRLQRLVAAADVVTSALPRRGSLPERLASGDFDVLLVDDGQVPQAPEPWVGAVRDLPERPEVLVLADREDPARRAALLAAGCLAVIGSGLPDERLQEALGAVVQRRRDQLLQRLRLPPPDDGVSLADFVSRSPAMQVFLRVAHRVSRTDSSLLILGETGVGKERLARAIHAAGKRARGPFLAVNCAALAESLLESELFGHEEGAFTGASRARRGYFELAHGGTLFLDEIGEIPGHLQVKLLRALEDRKILRVGGEKPVAVDVRLMAATNRDLEEEMRAGRFRPDLYYRLAVVSLVLPPLRERREDIPDLAGSYLEHFRRRLPGPVREIGPEAMEALVRYDWPGNVRELINAMERVVLLTSGTTVQPSDLPLPIAGPPTSVTDLPERRALRVRSGEPLPEARRRLLDAFERDYLSELLTATGGRIGETARRAGITDRSLYDLMRRHGLRKEDFRTPSGPR